MQRQLVLLDSNEVQVENYEDGHVVINFSADEDETPGLVAGCAISAVSVAAFGAWRAVSRRRTCSW
ncbi:hypothetical protein [Paratractidigestivibacter sp.]|nr:hypothetical protein [Paratractidigestivibacter sp.]